MLYHTSYDSHIIVQHIAPCMLVEGLVHVGKLAEAGDLGMVGAILSVRIAEMRRGAQCL